MLLRLSFCVEWFVSKLKREFKTPLTMVLENWKKKQKGIPLSSRLLAQRSSRPAPSLTPHRPASPLQAQVAPQAS
jgi:hypothetical protein